MLCYLAAAAAGSADAEDIKDEIRNVSGPPGTKYTFEQLPQAIQALKDGKDIDYEGASGPIDLDDAGDLSRYDLHDHPLPERKAGGGQAGHADRQREVAASRRATHSE